MADEWESGEDPQIKTEQGQPEQDTFEKRLEDIRRRVVQGASEAQQRLKRVVDKAGNYWQQAQGQPQTNPIPPQQTTSVEEQRIRQLANMWSTQNWRTTRDLGSSMELISWSTDEIWEVTIQTRWETRSMEAVTEPYTGTMPGRPQPILPAWDYELPIVTGLKAPASRARMDGLDDVLACTPCNTTGHLLCTTCTGRGYIVCPDCRGRMKKRCTTCRGRGYIADWAESEKKPFFQKQAQKVADSFNEKVSDAFEGIRQRVPIPNPVDTDPAKKGRTIPCPDCINGEVECTCGNGKRVCASCEGSKTVLCTSCGGTGKIVRHREIARRFDLRTQSQLVGTSAIPERQLAKASGEVIYTAEINEPLYADAVPDKVPAHVWSIAVDLVKSTSTVQEKPGAQGQAAARPSLQVLELVRVPYTKVDYRFSNQDYTFYAYDSEGKEKFYADRHPARWDSITRLVRAITADLTTPAQEDTKAENLSGGYHVPVEMPPYSITEEEDDL